MPRLNKKFKPITLDTVIDSLSKDIKKESKIYKSKEIFELPFNIDEELEFNIIEHKNEKILSAPSKESNLVSNSNDELVFKKVVKRTIPVLEERFKGKNITWL